MAPKRTPPSQLVFEALRDSKWDKAVKASKLEGYTSTGLLAAVRRIFPLWKPVIEPIVINAIRAGASQALCLIADAYGSLPDPDLQGTQYDHLLLDLAMREDRADVFTALLDHGILPTVPERLMGRSLLMVAVELKATECVRVCLERRVCGLEERDSQGLTALLLCACAGTAEILRLLARAGCNLLAKTDFGAHALSCAAAFVHVDIMEALLDLGFPIDFHNKGFPALHKVAVVEEPAKLSGATAAARLLLDHGAVAHDVCVDHLHWTPLHFVGQSGNLALAKLLLERGASVSTQDDDGRTPLNVAAEFGHVTLMALLISKGADINATFSSGYTPLTTAIRRGDANAVRLLVRAGCDLSKRAAVIRKPPPGANDSVAETLADVNVLHLAVIYKMQLSDFEAIASCLIQARPQLLEEFDGDGLLPLHRCVEAGVQDQNARVKLLLSLGADVDACTAVASDVTIRRRTDNGLPSTTVVRTKKSALLLAAETSRYGVVLLLIERGASIHVGGSPEGQPEGPGSSLALDLFAWLESSRDRQPEAHLNLGLRCLLALWYYGAVPQRRPLSPHESVSGMEALGAHIKEVEASVVGSVWEVNNKNFRRAVAHLREVASAAVPEVYQLYYRSLALLSYRSTSKPFEDYLVSRGALPLLAEPLASPHPLVQEHAALCLSRLAESRSAAAHLSRVQGIVSGLVGLLSPGKRPAATHWACRCLFELCQTPLGKARFLWGLGELGTGPAGAGAELPKGISLGPGDPDASAAGGGDDAGTSPGRRNVTAVLSLLSREGCWPATREWAAQCLLVALRTPHVPSPSQEAPAWSLEGSGASDGPGGGLWAGLVRRREVLASAARAAGAVLGPAGLALLRSSLSLDTLAGLVEEEGLYSESGSVLRLASWL